VPYLRVALPIEGGALKRIGMSCDVHRNALVYMAQGP
jgi:hypothetical protein